MRSYKCIRLYFCRWNYVTCEYWKLLTFDRLLIVTLRIHLSNELGLGMLLENSLQIPVGFFYTELADRMWYGNYTVAHGQHWCCRGQDWTWKWSFMAAQLLIPHQRLNVKMSYLFFPWKMFVSLMLLYIHFSLGNGVARGKQYHLMSNCFLW